MLHLLVMAGHFQFRKSTIVNTFSLDLLYHDVQADGDIMVQSKFMAGK